MWNESQIDRIRELAGEVDYLRRETQQRLDLDHLTGLLNQAALSRRVDQPGAFEGVVAVCDMDNFKDINDRYGHLVGDEILRNIGNLLKSSIRHEDEAFRWGGDEFVMLFRNQRTAVANKRMQEISARLPPRRPRPGGTRRRVLAVALPLGVAPVVGAAQQGVNGVPGLDKLDYRMPPVMLKPHAEAAGRVLREALDEADQSMYALKRTKQGLRP